MKASNIVTNLVVAAGLVAAGTIAWAPATLAAKGPSIDFSSDSKIWLEGDSTLHPYKSTSSKFEIKAALTNPKPQDASLSDLTVEIPVKSLKSGEGPLDTNLYKTMEASKYPTIKFNMSNAKVKVSNSGDVDVTAEGVLNIHGQEKTIEVTADGKLSGNTVRLKGKKSILMSDFGVKAPVLMFGAIKCTDKITVGFDLVGELK
ncbi:MAG TPA: YceI family protein [Stenomitos sp.]